MRPSQWTALGLALAVLSLAGGAAAQSDDALAMTGAALNDRPDRIEELVASGMPVDKGFMGMTALCMAVADDSGQHLESVKALLKAGASVNRHCGPAERTPLHDAALDGDVDLVRLLLAHGADRSARTKYGRTPLDFATNPPAPLRAPANSAEVAALLQTLSLGTAPAPVVIPPLTPAEEKANKTRDAILAARQTAYEAGSAEAEKDAKPTVVSYGPDFPAVQPVRPDTDQVGLRLGLMATLLLLAALAGYFVGRRRGKPGPAGENG